jgi:hypothetical protein
MPTSLLASCAYVYNDNLYVTDDTGNIAYIDCEMIHTEGAGAIKTKHSEYKLAGGQHVAHDNMDAGHLGVQIGQHPSIAMEQDSVMNRYGSWRIFERGWDKLSREGHTVNVKAVFVEGEEDGTFAPFWCIRETIDKTEVFECTLLNESEQY